jgi:hypothetical protein
MDKEDVVYINTGVSCSHKEEWNYVICRKMDRTEDNHIEQDKPNSERQTSHVFTYMWNLNLKRW